jgi:hypothetical protein
MSKKGVPTGPVAFEYDCSCGEHFVSVGQAVSHINKFKDHRLTRRVVEK